MNTKNIIILVAGLVVVGMAIRYRPQHTGPASSPAQTEPVSTRSIPRPRLPAPRIKPQATPVEAVAEILQPTNAFARLFKEDGELPKLRRDQIESYLAQNRRSAESLTAAYCRTGDRSLLQEAAEKQPHDPRVSFAGWMSAYRNENSAPEERRQCLDAFKQSAPDNALANYLSAQDYFKSGQTDRAVEELIAAAGKSKFQDYSADYVQNAEEAYLAGGCSESEAKAAAAYTVWLPHMTELKRLGESLRDLGARYRQAGDEPSAHAVLEMGLQLGERLEESSGGSTTLRDMMGLAIQRSVLQGLEPGAPYGNTGQTVQNELDTLLQRRESLKILWKQVEPILQNMPDQELVSYFDRMKTFGELEALRWVMNRQANQ
jgi:hypothetical protein